MQPALVNIGCGATWHPSWTNLDVHPLSPQVRSWDVSHGLPFGTEQVDACYASHVLEHLTRAQARALLLESFRVLRPGGIIRLVVPDLEAIVREYLDVVARADKGEEAALSQYEWITLELLDQLVRDKSGGEMEHYLRSKALTHADYVIARIGPEAASYMGVQTVNGHRSNTGSEGASERRCAIREDSHHGCCEDDSIQGGHRSHQDEALQNPVGNTRGRGRSRGALSPIRGMSPLDVRPILAQATPRAMRVFGGAHVHGLREPHRRICIIWSGRRRRQSQKAGFAVHGRRENLK